MEGNVQRQGAHVLIHMRCQLGPDRLNGGQDGRRQLSNRGRSGENGLTFFHTSVAGTVGFEIYHRFTTTVMRLNRLECAQGRSLTEYDFTICIPNLAMTTTILRHEQLKQAKGMLR